MASTFDTQWGRATAAVVRAFGVSVTLSRAGTTLATFTARRNDRVYEVFGQDGLPTKAAMVEWKFDSDDLSGATPKAGDRITEGSEVYEIMPHDSLPATEYREAIDEHLVRTKRIS